MMIIIILILLLLYKYFKVRKVYNAEMFIIFKQIETNILKVKPRIANNVKFGFVIKTGYPIIRYLMNKYGNRAVYKLAQYVEKYVDIFCISSIHTGIHLRKNNIKKPILILYLIEPSDVYLAEKYDLQIVIPSLEWYNIAKPYIVNKIRAHLWFDSNLGKEGVTNENDLVTLYNNIKKLDKVDLVGIGTKYNTEDSKYNYTSEYKLKIPTDIVNQHNKFKLILDKINDNKLIVHTACSFEVFRNYKDSYFNMTRIGTLLYGNIKFKQCILDIKYKNTHDCFGYLCVNSKRLQPNRFVRLGLLKNILQLDYRTKNNITVYYNNNKLEILYDDYDPIAIIVTDDIKIGDYVTIVYDERFTNY